MALRDHIPPPSLESLTKLQLMRYSLVKFVDWKNFEEVIQGCFVRVLLEMRHDRTTPNGAGTDSYYVAVVKGAQKGPSYSGFSWDGLTTEWHIVIELPPCFRSTPNNNVVQFNSISNSQFKVSEYEAWVQMSREASRGFITVAQIDLRWSLLQEHMFAAGANPSNPRRRMQRNITDWVDPDPVKQQHREQLIQKYRKEADDTIRKECVLLPAVEELSNLKYDNLLDIQRECLDLIARIRLAISERIKCHLCGLHLCTVVCYPCKHLVSCKGCAERIVTCPVAGCDKPVLDKFEPFTA